MDGYALVADALGNTGYTPTPFPDCEDIACSVASGGTWTYSFEITTDDLTSPVAATILLDGEAACVWDFGPWGCALYEWRPDLDVPGHGVGDSCIGEDLRVEW